MSFPTFTNAEQLISESDAISHVEVEDLFTEYKMCFYSPLGTICIIVITEFKMEPVKELKLKSVLSRDGQSILLSGFPPYFKGESFKVNKPVFSGYTFKEDKMYIQAGTYKVSNGKTTLRLKKG